MAEPMTDAGVVVRSAGGPEVLEWTALETAKPGRGEVRIEQRKFSDLASGGSLFATRPMLFDYIKSREDLSSRAADLFSRLASGEIKAHIGQRVGLRDAAAAHRDLESRRTIGATVLLP